MTSFASDYVLCAQVYVIQIVFSIYLNSPNFILFHVMYGNLCVCRACKEKYLWLWSEQNFIFYFKFEFCCFFSFYFLFQRWFPSMAWCVVILSWGHVTFVLTNGMKIKLPFSSNLYFNSFYFKSCLCMIMDAMCVISTLQMTTSKLDLKLAILFFNSNNACGINVCM